MRVLFLLFTAVCICSDLCFALDWKDLHERADKMTVDEASYAAGNNPGSVDNLYLLGLACLNARRDDEAADAFTRILDIAPQEAAAKWGMAEVLRRRHKLDESQNMLEDVIVLDPGFAPACISMAYIKYTKLDFEGTLQYARRVLVLGTGKADIDNYVRAQLIIGGAKGMLAHYGGVFSKVFNGMAVFPTLRKAESMQPDSPAVLFGMGSFYLLAPKAAGGNPEKAVEYLEKAQHSDPLFADIYVRLAQAYKIKGDAVKYNTLLNKALEIDPGNELANDVKSGSCRFICPAGDS